MEYALKLEAPGELPDDPRCWCDGRWGGALPAGPLVALYLGSEFCEERLPSSAEAARLCRLAGERGLAAVLLTPIVRPRGLERVAGLLAELAVAGLRPSVVFNDWGVLELLRARFPSLPRRGGRLLNRALRDPRLANATAPKAEGEVAGERGRYLRELLRRVGAIAVETDVDLEGGFLGAAGGGLERTLHLPYVFAASGRNCLVRASVAAEEDSFTRGLGSGCAAPCRAGPLGEVREDADVPLWRAGNTLFYEAPERLASSYLRQADRVVLHRRPSP